MGQWLDSLTGWLSANPQWLGLAIFLVACIECLAIAGLTGVGAWLWERNFLTSAHGHPHVPGFGEVPLASAALFDLGVYITVVGATLLTLSVLGHASKEGRGATSAPVRSRA
mgnify:CR=1 FL=1